MSNKETEKKLEEIANHLMYKAPQLNIPKLSFCITCKNRLHQLSQTLSKNLDDNRMSRDLIEFVLVDFGSTDGLQEWIFENFQNDLDTGYLKYFYTEKLPFWHASIAKNTAHLLADHEILVNLDCDNFTGINGGRLIIGQFLNQKNDIITHQFGGDIYDGSYGRIGVKRERFLEVGGYNEEFESMAYQDTDLINRLVATGSQYINIPDPRYNQAIRNTKEEGVLHTNSSISWIEMLSKNKKISEENIRNKQFRLIRSIKKTIPTDSL